MEVNQRRNLRQEFRASYWNRDWYGMMLTDLFSLLSYTPQDCVHRNGSDQNRLDYSTTGISGENVPVDVSSDPFEGEICLKWSPPLSENSSLCEVDKKKKRQKNNVTYLVRLFSEDKHYTKWWETQDYRRKKYNSVEVTKNLFSRRKLVWHWWLILLFKIIYLMLSCTQKPPLSVEDTTIN